jgi:hypothetical protein
MNFLTIINDRGTKLREKTETLCKWILEHPEQVQDLIDFATASKSYAKATCIEAIDYATAENPEIATIECLTFVTQNLSDNSPRVKWESARVIGNIAHLYPAYLGETVRKLLINSTFDGTMVRWSTAFALGEIIKLNTKLNTTLVPAIEAIVEREIKSSIRRTYLMALKRVKK